MKKLLYIFLTITLLSCGGDDDVANFNVIVDNLTTDSAKITWIEPSDFSGDVIYRVVLENETVADGLQATQYIFENLDENKNYSGTIFAESTNDEQTFSNFNFTTNPITVLQGTVTVRTQAEVDNFQYTEVNSLRIEGTEISNLDGLSSLEIINDNIFIIGTSLINLNALENIVSNQANNGVFTQVTIGYNSNLVDISGLYNYIATSDVVSIYDNTSLSNINGLQLMEEMKFLGLNNCPLDNIPIFNTIKYSDRLILTNIPLSNLNSFINAEIIRNFRLTQMGNLENLSGLNNLTDVNVLAVLNNQNFDSFEGAPLLTNTIYPIIEFYCKDNSAISNYCGLIDWMINTEIYQEYDEYTGAVIYTGFEVENNAYNPTEQQIESTTECSQ